MVTPKDVVTNLGASPKIVEISGHHSIDRIRRPGFMQKIELCQNHGHKVRIKSLSLSMLNSIIKKNSIAPW